MKKLIAILSVVLFVAFSAQAQEKPIRIGIKLGIPNILGLNAEYVTPLLDGKLAPTVDFSRFSITASDVSVSFSYFEIGGNYYFTKQGKGFYGHASYGNIGFTGTYTDPSLGEGEGKANFSLINLKLGAKLGNTFYFRPEIGYAIGGGATLTVDYVGQQQEEEIPGLFGGGFVGNIGFGFAF